MIAKKVFMSKDGYIVQAIISGKHFAKAPAIQFANETCILDITKETCWPGFTKTDAIANDNGSSASSPVNGFGEVVVERSRATQPLNVLEHQHELGNIYKNENVVDVC